jgi:hypothetical protein
VSTGQRDRLVSVGRLTDDLAVQPPLGNIRPSSKFPDTDRSARPAFVRSYVI